MPSLPSEPSESAEPVTASHAASVRQARALATRERILEAAAQDFASVGYHGSSLSRILERSQGVTKGALYFHFASKEAMALAVVEQMGEAYRATAERTASEVATAGGRRDPLRHAVRLAVGVHELLRSSPAVRAGERLAIEGAVGGEWLTWPTRFWLGVFSELFSAAHECGDVRPEVDPSGMGRFVVDISHGAFTGSLALTRLADLDERVAYNWDVMFSYMAAPSWLAGWLAEGGMAVAMGVAEPPRAP